MTSPADHSGSSSRLAALCPYCGHGHELGPGKPRPLQCEACKGRFEPLSRQATQNAMGPWQVRDEAHPFRPPCSYETIVRLAQRGKVIPTTIVRGPTTRQFWMYARDTPGVAAVLGFCHACHTPISADDAACPSCEAVLRPEADRQHLGLSPKAALPGEAPPEQIAAMIRPQTPQAMPLARPDEPVQTTPKTQPERVEQARPTDAAPLPVEPVNEWHRPGGSGWVKGLAIGQAVVIAVLVIALILQVQRPGSDAAEEPEDNVVATADGAGNDPAEPVASPPADPPDATEQSDDSVGEGSADEPLRLMDDAMRPFDDRYWAIVEGTRSDDADVLERSIEQLRSLRDEAAEAQPEADFTLTDDLIEQAQQRLMQLRLIEEFGGRP